MPRPRVPVSRWLLEVLEVFGGPFLGSGWSWVPGSWGFQSSFCFPVLWEGSLDSQFRWWGEVGTVPSPDLPVSGPCGRLSRPLLVSQMFIVVNVNSVNVSVLNVAKVCAGFSRPPPTPPNPPIVEGNPTVPSTIVFATSGLLTFRSVLHAYLEKSNPLSKNASDRSSLCSFPGCDVSAKFGVGGPNIIIRVLI
jgi:hypothetical protein